MVIYINPVKDVFGRILCKLNISLFEFRLHLLIFVTMICLLILVPLVENGVDGPIKMDPGTLLSLEYASGRKRRITENEGSDEEDTNTGPAPPVNDIYRSRQQKRAK